MGPSESHLRRIAAVVESTGAGLLIAPASVRDRLRETGADLSATITLSPEELAATPPASSLTASSPRPEDLAFLQFTSGSTGRPRAVAVSHGAVLHNNRATSEAIGAPHGAPVHEWAEGTVAWLPLHHDMGLVGCLLLSMTLGLDVTLLQPTAFLARPRLWLQELSKLGPTYSPAPNFGFQLCAERLRPEEIEGLDLSRWWSALAGAEMVRPDTTAAFADRVASCGFRPEQLRPCYGLAEATLAVTVDVEGRGVRTREPPGGAEASLGMRDVACVGRPLRDTRIEIRAPDGAALPEDRLGEVCVEGPGLFDGYHGDPAATAEVLAEGWVRTGDLGFLNGGELYIAGRLKDVLILRGDNVMPHELEWLAESVAGTGGTERAGAFSISRGPQGEEPVLVVETTVTSATALAELGRAVRQRVGRDLGLPLADLAFVRRGRIPKTTSGKVRRRELARRYLDAELERLDTRPN
jgi:acyl-CoA synthetase (AMP-forming)/AMP-acid ligase II